MHSHALASALSQPHRPDPLLLAEAALITRESIPTSLGDTYAPRPKAFSNETGSTTSTPSSGRTSPLPARLDQELPLKPRWAGVQLADFHQRCSGRELRVNIESNKVRRGQSAHLLEGRLEKDAKDEPRCGDFRAASTYSPLKISIRTASLKTPNQVCFAMAGIGSQWWADLPELMGIPSFSEAIQRCSAALVGTNINLIDVFSRLRSVSGPAHRNSCVNTCVALTAIQIGLLATLTAHGITPDLYFGHSLGENVCAYLDGALTSVSFVLASSLVSVPSLLCESLLNLTGCKSLCYSFLRLQNAHRRLNLSSWLPSKWTQPCSLVTPHFFRRFSLRVTTGLTLSRWLGRQ
jgi:hypothetical protein